MGNKNYAFSFLLLLSTLLGGASFARASDSGSDSVPEAESASRFNFLTEVDFNNSLHRFSSADHKSSIDWTLQPGYLVTPQLNLVGIVNLNQDLEGDTLTQVDRTELGIVHSGWQLGQLIKFTPRLWAVLPLYYHSVAEDSLQLGVKLNPRFTFDLTPIGAPAVSGMVEFVGRRSFHQYTTTAAGSVNTEYSWSNRLYVSLAPSPKYAFITDFVYGSSWSYFGNVKNSFTWAESVEFYPNKRWTLAAGISTGGNALKANGTDSAIELVDPNTTNFIGSLIYSY